MKDFGAECRDVRFREVGVRILSVLGDFPPVSSLLTVLADSRDSPQS
jgi:hypothetical protein